MKQRLGRNVRRYRERIGFTQLQLAEQIGMSQTSIGLLERGNVWPEYENLQAICMVLKVPETALFEGESPKVEPTPLEALEIVAQALKAQQAPATPDLSRLRTALGSALFDRLLRADESEIDDIKLVLEANAEEDGEIETELRKPKRHK